MRPPRNSHQKLLCPNATMTFSGLVCTHRLKAATRSCRIKTGIQPYGTCMNILSSRFVVTSHNCAFFILSHGLAVHRPYLWKVVCAGGPAMTTCYSSDWTEDTWHGQCPPSSFAWAHSCETCATQHCCRQGSTTSALQGFPSLRTAATTTINTLCRCIY